MSGPDQVWSCSLTEHEEEERPKWFLGAAGTRVWTALRFREDLRADQTRNALLVTAAYAPIPKLSLAASAGATLGGELRTPAGVHEFDAGPTFALGVAYRLVEDVGFVSLSGVLSASFASTRAREGEPSATYRAFDLRLGIVAGVTLLGVLRPYAVGRVFGGPVFWRYRGEDVTGTDVSHVQLGAGLGAALTDQLDIFVEGVPLGERALSAGLMLAL